MINHLCNDSLFGRQRCQNHRPGSPQRRLQRPEVLHRPTPVTPYCDGGLHRTPDRRPAAKIRIRNDPPQPPGKRSAQSGSGGEPNAAANLFRKSEVSGMTGASERVESAERTGLPNICRHPLPKTAPAEQTDPSDIPCPPRKYRLRDKPAFRISAVLGENSACRADMRPEHPPPRGRAALRTVGRPPQLRLHTPGNDEDSTRA